MECLLRAKDTSFVDCQFSYNIDNQIYSKGGEITNEQNHKYIIPFDNGTKGNSPLNDEALLATAPAIILWRCPK